MQAAPDDAKLPEKVDLALLVDTYHHIDDRAGYFSRLKASLAPQGRIAIIGFTLASEIGLELAGEHLFLPNQYFLVFRPE